MEGTRHAKMSSCCCDPFKLHRKKVISSLRVITDEIKLRHPNLSLEKGQKLCVQCRKKIEKLPATATSLPESVPAQPSSSSTSGEEQSTAAIDAEQSCEGTASEAEDHELQLLNLSLGSIEETPVRKRRFKSQHYLQKKVKKVESTVRKKLELISGAPLPEISERADESELISQLRKKFSDTNLRSEKLTILTVLPQSWTLQKIQQEFAVTRYMARQAKNLVREKGILSTPNCRGGKSLPTDTANVTCLVLIIV